MTVPATPDPGAAPAAHAGLRAAVAHEVRLFLIALQFLTRLPVPRDLPWRDEWMHASARHFPLVGAVVGLIAVAVLGAALLVFPPTVAAGLSLAATLLATGAFHEDGLADTCDGLGGAVSRERALAIMKDSRIGSYGAVGLAVVLGLKWTTLAALAARAPAMAALATVWAHAASRGAPLLLMRVLPYAGDADHAKAKPMATRLSTAGLAAAGAVLAVVAAALGPGAGRLTGTGLDLAVLAGGASAVGLTAAAAAAWLRRRLGGHTGDTLGASQQVAEVAVLLVALAL